MSGINYPSPEKVLTKLKQKIKNDVKKKNSVFCKCNFV